MKPLLPDYFPPILQQQARLHELTAGEELFQVNEAVTHLFYVQAGELKAIRYLPDGGEVTMLRARSSEFLGESTLAIERYVCKAVAMNAVQVVAMPMQAVKDALAADSAFAFRFLLEVAKTSRKQCSRYERLRLKNASDRVLHYLLCESGGCGMIEYPTHLYEWAHELGLQKETLYRTLAALEQVGKISRTDKVIKLLS
jgi:CRP/FNR family transcriptional regulator